MITAPCKVMQQLNKVTVQKYYRIKSLNSGAGSRMKAWKWDGELEMAVSLVSLSTAAK